MVNKEEFKNFVKNTEDKYLKYQDIKYKKRALILMAITLALGVFTLVFKNNKLLLIIFASLTVFSFVIAYRLFKRISITFNYYRDFYLNDVVSLLLDEDCNINHYDFIEEDKFVVSKFADYERFYGNDKLVFKVNGSDVVLSDIRCYLLNSEKNDFDCTYSGTFGYAFLNKDFKGVLSLFEEYREEGMDLEKIDINGISVYSNNSENVSLVFDEEMVKNIIYLKEYVGNIKLLVKNDVIYFGFSDKNLFNANLLKNDKLDEFYDGLNVLISVLGKVIG